MFQAQKRKKSKHKGGDVDTVVNGNMTTVNGNTPTTCDNNRSLPNHPSSNTASAQSTASQLQDGNKNLTEKQSNKPRPSPQGSSSPAAPLYSDNRTVITATINPNPKNNKNTNKNQGGTPGVVELNAKQAQQHLHEQIIEQITKQKQQELLKQQQALIQLKVQEEVQKQLRNQAQKLQQQLQQPGQQKQQQPGQQALQPGQQQQKQTQVQTPGQQQLRQQQQQQPPIQPQQKQAQSQKQQSASGQQQPKANLNANQIQKPVTTQNRPQPNNNPQNNASSTSTTNSPSKTKKSGHPRVESPASKAKEQNNNVKINNKVLQPQLNNIITQAQQSVQAQQSAQNQQASQGKKSRARQDQLIEERVKAVNLAHARNSLHPAPPPAYNSHFGQPVQNSTVVQNGMGSPVKVQKQERPAPQGQARSGDVTPRKQDPGRGGKQDDTPPSDQGRNSGGKSKKMRKKNKGAEDINFIGEQNFYILISGGN